MVDALKGVFARDVRVVVRAYIDGTTCTHVPSEGSQQLHDVWRDTPGWVSQLVCYVDSIGKYVVFDVETMGLDAEMHVVSGKSTEHDDEDAAIMAAILTSNNKPRRSRLGPTGPATQSGYTGTVGQIVKKK